MRSRLPLSPKRRQDRKGSEQERQRWQQQCRRGDQIEHAFASRRAARTQWIFGDPDLLALAFALLELQFATEAIMSICCFQTNIATQAKLVRAIRCQDMISN
jgi:hypothetical protein